jgi:hypothetical protein
MENSASSPGRPHEVLIEAPEIVDHLLPERHVAPGCPLSREPEVDVEAHLLARHQGVGGLLAQLRTTEQRLTGRGGPPGDSQYARVRVGREVREQESRVRLDVIVNVHHDLAPRASWAPSLRALGRFW